MGPCFAPHGEGRPGAGGRRRGSTGIDRDRPREARRRLRDAGKTNPGTGGGVSKVWGREGGRWGEAGTSMGVMQSLTVLTVISSAPRIRLASALGGGRRR